MPRVTTSVVNTSCPQYSNSGSRDHTMSQKMRKKLMDFTLQLFKKKSMKSRKPNELVLHGSLLHAFGTKTWKKERKRNPGVPTSKICTRNDLRMDGEATAVVVGTMELCFTLTPFSGSLQLGIIICIHTLHKDGNHFFLNT